MQLFVFLYMLLAYALVFGVLCIVHIEPSYAAAFYYMVLDKVMGTALYAVVICFAEAVLSSFMPVLAYCFKEYFCHSGVVAEYYTKAKKDIENEACQREALVKLHSDVGAKLLEFMQMIIDERAVSKEAEPEGSVKAWSSPACDAASILSAAHTE